MLVYEWPKFSDTHVCAHIFRMKGYIDSNDSIWIGQLSVKSCIWMGCCCFFLQKPGIWLGLVSKYWLTHPYQNYHELSPPPPPPPPPSLYWVPGIIKLWCLTLYLEQNIRIDRIGEKLQHIELRDWYTVTQGHSLSVPSIQRVQTPKLSSIHQDLYLGRSHQRS